MHIDFANHLVLVVAVFAADTESDATVASPARRHLSTELAVELVVVYDPTCCKQHIDQHAEWLLSM